MEKAVGINVTLEPTEFTTSLNSADAGNVRRLRGRLVGPRRPGRQHLRLRRDAGDAELLRLLEREARLHPERRAQVGDDEGARHALRGRDEDHPRDRPLIYLYHPVNYYGVSKKVTGVKIYGDGLIRAAVRRVTRSRTIMGGFLLRKAGAALIVVFCSQHRRLRGRAGAAGRSRRRARAARTATPRCSPAIRQKYGLDQPLPEQYVKWVVARACRAISASTQRDLPVAHTIVTRIPITLELAFLSVLLGVLIGISSGVIAAVRRGKASDHAATTFALVGLSRAALLARAADDHPVRGQPRLAAGERLRLVRDDPVENLEHMVMPAVVLGTGLSAVLMRQMRSSMLDLARRRLRAHGAREGTVGVVGRRQARASQQPDHRDDGDRAAARRADLRRGDHRADLRHPRLRAADARGDQPARLHAAPGRRARRRDRLRRRQPARRRRLLAAEPADPRDRAQRRELRRPGSRVHRPARAPAPAPAAALPAPAARGRAASSSRPCSSSRRSSRRGSRRTPPARATSPRLLAPSVAASICSAPTSSAATCSRASSGARGRRSRPACSRRCSRWRSPCRSALVAGYYRGWIDTVIARMTDVLLAFPFLIVAVGLAAILGPSLHERDDRARRRRRARR